MRRPSLGRGSLLPVAVAAVLLAASTPRAIELRELGLAELENERPAEAEKAFRSLVKVAPDDPLGYANLAIAALRQQRPVEALALIDRALTLAPERADLLAIKGEVAQWAGRGDQALELYRQAAARAPDDPEILYALYRQAQSLQGSAAEGAQRQALQRLAALRPENVVVMLQLGQRAIAEGDRAAATRAFLRLGELLWQAPPIATTAFEQVETALAGGDLAAARVPAVRLENVLKVSPMYQQSLRELQMGIQGVPVTRFQGEPRPAAFGKPLQVSWVARPLAAAAGRAVVAADFDGDQRPDLAWITGSGDDARLELRLASQGWKVSLTHPAPGVERLLVADLDNDGHRDLVGLAGSRVLAWRGAAGGKLLPATAEFGLDAAQGVAGAAFDYDVEGDLDLALAGGGQALQLWRNDLSGPLQAVGDRALPRLAAVQPSDLVASDLDRDGVLDLLLVHDRGLTWLENLRQGKLADRTPSSRLRNAAAARLAVSADLDNDSLPDLITAGERLVAWRNEGGDFAVWALDLDLPGEATALVALDFDNDGRLDLAAATAAGITLFHQQEGAETRFRRETPAAAPRGVVALAAADLDGDGDLDLVTAGSEGLIWLENQGGNRNHWLAVRLRGLTRGSSKNNSLGAGAVVEVKAGAASQFREADGGVAHFGLGSRKAADVLRVVWTNGVPQNRLGVAGDQEIVEEQVLKGSCPFLYAWDGDGIAFVTDLLWGAPIGLPLAPGVWAAADPSELVEVVGAVPRDGHYDLRVTEELWEAAFFDHVRLWVVDHPADVEVASTLRILPGERVPEGVLASRALRPVAAAWDGEGRAATAAVAARDQVYADGYPVGRYQGVAAEPWAFTFDLGAAPTAPVRLHLDGWIFPADASLNLAVAQRSDLPYTPPRLEVETPTGWQLLLPAMGFPAGKTKTMVVDLPPLPAGSSRLRIVSNLWLSWDRIAWTTDKADAAPRVVAQLLPATAELRFRGFSQLVRQAPNAPHAYDYADSNPDSPWLPFAGSYTRYGDVRELLAAADDRSVVMAAGDEMALAFEASALPAPPAGWRRTVFLESHGWDKDADRNTYQAQHLEPLPFRAMSGYPYAPGESFPDTPLHRQYREEWLTRVVAPESAGRAPR
ncbi:MAG TPA: FG-GAP-like repeat-containing protein [Thermoanaerobaculia bacterium]|nr:FG-GAP-like repeat-containing protein [Thermoanaerobaculia bacterium]